MYTARGRSWRVVSDWSQELPDRWHDAPLCDGPSDIKCRKRYVNTLRPRQNGRRFADDTFKRIFLNENVRISITISLKLVPKGPINNILSLVQIMAWRRSGDKPLSEPMIVRLPTHICVTWPQWVNRLCTWLIWGFMKHIFTISWHCKGAGSGNHSSRKNG